MEPLVETIVKKPTQFNIEKYLREYGTKLSKRLRPRAVLALEAINLMLRLEGYSGSELPLVVFKDGLTVNEIPRIGAFAYDWEGANDRSTIFVNIGDNPMEVGFGKKTIEHYRRQGLDDDQINKLVLVHFMFEEAYHFVDHTREKLPKGIGPTGMTPGLSHDEQPHEDRAKQAKEAATSLLFLDLIEGKPKMY